MFILSVQNNFCTILSSYLKGYVKSEFNLFSWFPYLEKLDIFGKRSVELVWKSFSGKNNFLEPPVFWFPNSCFIWSRRIDRVGSFDLMGFRVIDIQKYKKDLLEIFFFFSFWSRHYEFMNYFEIRFFFLISSLVEFQPAKY